MPSAVRLVWAQADGGLIGAGGVLPWQLPEDLRLFRALTLGSTVVMGRRTWSSLPPSVRPLPGRRNVVLSASLDSAEAGASVAGSVEEILQMREELWVIGGGGVYAAFLPHADEVVITEVDARLDGDTWAPPLDPEWVLGLRMPETGWFASSAGLRFRVSWWHRATADGGRPPSPVPDILGRSLAGQPVAEGAS